MTMSVLVAVVVFVGLLVMFGAAWAAVGALASLERVEDSWVDDLTRRIAATVMPDRSDSLDEVQLALVRAGIERPSSDVVFFAVRATGAIVVPGLVLALLRPDSVLWFAGIVAAGASAGYLLPRVWLDGRIAARQAQIRLAIPSFLEMLVPVVEAGMSVDDALRYVLVELEHTHPVMASIWIRALGRVDLGQSRDRALEDIVVRTGVDELAPVVHLLSRAERSGAGIRDALSARQAAVSEHALRETEQMMGKIGPYLTVAAIVFVLPVMLVVLVGPAIYQVIEMLVPTLGGGT
jgi:tight adherence protein C